MPADVPSLGELEVQVLRLVWQLQPCTERQVSERVRADRGVARTTVLKTIQRLEAKGRRFVAAFLGGSAEPLAAYLADAGGLSGRDVQQLKAIARKLRRDEAAGGGRG